jgi:hypothetical protein
VFEHLLPADQVFGINDGKFDAVFSEKIGKSLLALDLRKLAKVAITPQQVEGAEGEVVLLTCGEFGMEFGEVVLPSFTTTTSPSMIA